MTKQAKNVRAKAHKVVAQNAALTVVFKKKRNTEPGIRHQGGRIYDSENGTSCHQCRQKTLEVKAACKSPHCNLHWCPRCLTNRYNEEVETVRHLSKWKCPKCRNICNCSNCRKKQGLQATGILANIARSAGFGSVSQLLEKNPKMSVIHPKREDKSGKDLKMTKKKAHKTKVPVIDMMDENRGGCLVHHKTSDLVPGASLKKRRRSMPAPVEPKIHLDEGCLNIPADLDTAKLTCVLEFFSSFAGTIGLPGMSVKGLAKDLVSPRMSHSTSTRGPSASPLVDALISLKTILCRWYGEKNVDADGLAWDSWLAARYSLPVSCDMSPPGLARPSRPSVRKISRTSGNSKHSGSKVFESPLGRRIKVYWPSEKDWFWGVVRKVDCNHNRIFVVYDDGDEGWEDLKKHQNWEFIDEKRGPSFWSWSPVHRLEAVDMLIHDAIQCGPIVDVIESSVESVTNAQKRQKEEIELVKKKISEEKERHKQRFIAELISSQQISNISAEKQQEILFNARQNASSSVSEENKSRLRWLKTSQFFKNCTGRTVALGEDGNGMSYFSLGCAEILTGSSKGIFCMSEDSIKCFGDAETKMVVEALDVSGEEGSLRMGLQFIM